MKFNFNNLENSRKSNLEKKSIPLKIGETVKEYAPAVLMGALTASVTYVGSKIDTAVQPEMIKALAENFHWWNVFTTEHSVAALVEKYGPLVPSVMGAFMTVAMGYMQYRKNN